MSDELVVLASFTTPVEADLLVWSLQTEGIRARLSDEATAGWMWHLSGAIGGVKVLVRQDDEPRAREFMRRLEEQRLADQTSGDLPRGPWQCPNCGERLAEEFELCWKCGTAYEPGCDVPEDPSTATPAHPVSPEDPVDAAQAPDEVWTCPSCNQSVSVEDRVCPLCGTTICGQVNPYFTRAGTSDSQHVGTRKRVTEDAEVLAVRAWRAAVIGAVILPPLLNIYSMYVLLTISVRHQGLTPAGNRRFYAALILNLVVGALVGTIGRAIFLDSPGAY